MDPLSQSWKKHFEILQREKKQEEVNQRSLEEELRRQRSEIEKRACEIAALKDTLARVETGKETNAMRKRELEKTVCDLRLDCANVEQSRIMNEDGLRKDRAVATMRFKRLVKTHEAWANGKLSSPAALTAERNEQRTAKASTEDFNPSVMSEACSPAELLGVLADKTCRLMEALEKTVPLMEAEIQERYSEQSLDDFFGPDSIWSRDFVPLHGEVLEALHAYGMHMSGQNDEQVGDEQVGEDLVDAQQQQT